MKLYLPEIEAGQPVAEWEAYGEHNKFFPQNIPADLLDVYSDDSRSVRAVCRKDLVHDALVEHCLTKNGWKEPRLRIIFFSSRHGAEVNDAYFPLSSSTLDWLHDRFEVTPAFLECLINPKHWKKTGNASFTTTEPTENGTKVVSLEGFYRFTCVFRLGPACVWFRHDMVSANSIYIVANISEDIQERVIKHFQQPECEPCRPLVVDGFIAEANSRRLQEDIAGPREALLRYERHRALFLPTPETTAKVVSELHHISQAFKSINEDTKDLEERIEHLITVYDTVYNAWRGRPQNPFLNQRRPVRDSLSFLLSRCHIMNRWVENYIERAKIQIELYFNLAAHSDMQTNLLIAKLTSQIAVQAQRDSSSMITMAAVTMFFLPGTFIAALFSMVFFNYSVDEGGLATFSVSPLWWYYAVVTIPLTVLVFIAWLGWRKLRDARFNLEDLLSQREARKDEREGERDIIDSKEGTGPYYVGMFSNKQC